MPCNICNKKDEALTKCSICRRDVCIKKHGAWIYHTDYGKLRFIRACTACKIEYEGKRGIQPEQSWKNEKVSSQGPALPVEPRL